MDTSKFYGKASRDETLHELSSSDSSDEDFILDDSDTSSCTSYEESSKTDEEIQNVSTKHTNTKVTTSSCTLENWDFVKSKQREFVFSANEGLLVDVPKDKFFY